MRLVLSAAIVLASVHLAVGSVHVRSLPEDYWSPAAGGIAVGYVFVHLFPALEARGTALEAVGVPLPIAADSLLYLAALLGFVAFYGVERIARASHDSDEVRGRDRTFWLHVGSFGVYNAFIGYLLHGHRADGAWELLSFVFAIGLHLAIVEYGLQHHHEGTYTGLGQWLLAGAVLFGAGVGFVVDLGTFGAGLLFAVLAGGIVLNVIKAELPAEQRGRFWPFAIGAVGYAVILLAQ